MEEYQNLDDTDEVDPDESPILREVRANNRRLEKENAKLTAKQAEWEVAAQTQRSETAKEIVNALGLPGLTEDVLQWVKGDITQELVVEALEARSIPVPQDAVQPTSDDNQPSASAVGQQVADAAAGKDGRSLDDRLAEASNSAELAAIMEEAGLSRSHS